MFITTIVACICIVILVLSFSNPNWSIGCRTGALAGQAYTASFNVGGTEEIPVKMSNPIVATGLLECDFDLNGVYEECQVEIDYQGKYKLISNGEIKEGGVWGSLIDGYLVVDVN